MIGFEFYTSEVKVGNFLHVSETFAYVTTIKIYHVLEKWGSYSTENLL